MMTEATNTTSPRPVGRPRGGSERAKRTSTVKPGESRADKFTRLALARMPKVKKVMRMVCNLAKYPYSEAQAAKLIGEIDRMASEVEVEAAFKPKGRNSDSFTF